MSVTLTPEPQAGGRHALLFGTSVYADARLGPLAGPAWDVEHFGGVLADPRLGGFAVTTYVDPTAQEMRTAVEGFLLARKHDDLVVVYLSGHGVLDRYNELYFAAADTDRDLLAATGLDADWFRRRLSRCVARRQVLILDCCHAGAYLGAESAGDLHLERLAEDARGRLVMHASRGTEAVFTAEADEGARHGSAFTGVLVEGLRTGAADLDQDGFVAAVELFAYAEQRMREAGAAQTPQLTVGHAEGRIHLARSPAGRSVKPAPIPDEIRQDLEHPRPGRRIGAVIDLAAWLGDPDPARVLAARLQLEAAVALEVPQVAQIAREQLARFAPDSAGSGPPGPAAAGTVPAGAPTASDQGAAAFPEPAEQRPRQPATRARAALDEAEGISARIKNDFLRAQALVGVVAAVAAIDPERAEHIAEGIEEESRKVRALVGLAAAVAAFDLERAERVAEGIDATEWRARARSGIATAVAESDPDEGERVAANIDVRLWKAQALAGVAIAVASSDPERAERLYDRAERMVDGPEGAGDEAWRTRALVRVAASVASADAARARRLFDRAKYAAGAIGDDAEKAEALAGLAVAAAASDPDRAERVARAVADEAWRARALADVAAALAVSDPPRALRLYDQAEQAATAIGHVRARAQALIGIVPALAAADPERASRVAESIGNAYWTSQAMAGLAPVVAASDPDLAARIAAGIHDESWKVRALIAIAKVWLDE